MDHEMKIRVLIADDSYFVRRYLHELLSQDADIAVVGEAKDGVEVVAMAAELHPDVITMDYRMPRKNGLDATAEIMLGSRPLPAVIILSAFAGTDGRETLERLRSAGALVIEKPSGEVSLDIDRIADEIVTTVKKVGDVQRRIRMYARALVARAGRATPIRKHSAPLAVVVIGASTGGPPLVEHLLATLGEEESAAFVIVQHMSKYFTELFSERLDRLAPMPVHEAKEGEELLPGTITVVPGNSAVTFDRGAEGGPHIRLHVVELPERRDEHAIDLTMRSAADLFGSATIGMVLSGMGSDGTDGLAAIKEAKGSTFAQDPLSATVSSMPESAISAGIVDRILGIEEMPSTLGLAIRRAVKGEGIEEVM